MGLKHRLDRLEKRSSPAAGPDQLPPDFFAALCGALPLADAHPETRRIIEPMLMSPGTTPPVADRPDPIEEEIEKLLARDLSPDLPHKKPER